MKRTTLKQTTMKQRNMNALVRLNGRRAVFFTLDAMMAAMLMIGGLLLLNQVATVRPSTEQVSFFAQDILLAMESVSVEEFNDSFVRDEINNGNITDPTNSILEQVGEYWALNKSDKARTLLANYLGNLSTLGYGVNISLYDNVSNQKNVFQLNASFVKNRIGARRMISGIKEVGENEALKGSTASAFVKRARNKKSSQYVYFGGFVGQGNITVFMDNIPTDVNQSDIIELSMELAGGGPFNLSINGQQCNRSEDWTNTSFFPNVNDTIPTEWNITYCKNFVTVPTTSFSLFFGNNISQAYITGGFIQLTYRTDVMVENITVGTYRYFFPGIEGLANLYDSISIPGNITDMSVYLHYNSTHAIRFYIGQQLVYENLSNGTGEDRNITLTDLDMSPVYLAYDLYSNKTVPIRLYSANSSFISSVSNDTDIVLITDLSGSMDWRMDQSFSNGVNIPDCSDVSLDDPAAKRVRIAACLDWTFVNYVKDASPNTTRIWLVHFDSSVANTSNMTRPDLNTTINDIYWPHAWGGGGTCICCGLERAGTIFQNNPAAGRKRTVILMTDGDANSDGTCTSFRARQDTCPGLSNAMRHAVNASWHLKNDYNATVYAVGVSSDFSTNGICMIEAIANVTGGNYTISANALALRNFYIYAANQSMNVTQNEQTLYVTGTLVPSQVYSDSHINITYTPNVEAPQPNEISIMLETSPLKNCTTTFDVPAGVRIIDAKVTSYSGSHWTSEVIINNNTIFNMSEFSSDFTTLGDPFIIMVSPAVLVPGENNITLLTGDAPGATVGCSENNTLIFTAMVNASTERSVVLPRAEGCNWTIEFEDGYFSYPLVPSNYSGTKRCFYTSGATGIVYNDTDVYDVAIYLLLRQLDYDDNGKVLVNLDQFDLELAINLLGQVPYLWGPSIVEVDVWR